jgi:alkylation response protein AidB-like acyl-CoA dehydrogenase
MVCDVGRGVAQRAASTHGNATACVELARTLGPLVQPPGLGQTAQRWAVLTSIATGDLSAARIAEAHLDALAILAESGEEATGDSTWGVYAAEGPGVRVEARKGAGDWELSGTKPWCSAARHLDCALVTAHVGDEGRRLFAVDLRTPGVATTDGGWVSRGLADVTSGPVTFDRARAVPVGETGWYLNRSGFAWGGIGVAACWYGGVVALARSVWSAARSREPDQIALMHLGEVDLQVERCRLALAEAARRVDEGTADGQAGVVLAERVRGSVAAAVEVVIRAAAHTLGPAPLAMDEEHARRVADLQVYVRQHHAERDSARLGRLLRDTEGAPW